jgi:hypothetical protein
MNIPLKDLNTVLDAFKQGYRDAYHRGVFNNIYKESCSSAYKQGYDFGMTIYCEVNHPEEEIEAHE